MINHTKKDKPIGKVINQDNNGNFLIKLTKESYDKLTIKKKEKK